LNIAFSKDEHRENKLEGQEDNPQDVWFRFQLMQVKSVEIATRLSKNLCDILAW